MAIDIEQLEDSPHLLDLLIQMEDVLDSLDIYVFKNWINGEIVEGPKVRRYWLDMTLKFDHDKMPDPRAGLRLLKHGVRIDFERATEDTTGTVKESEEDKSEKKDEKDTAKLWLVRISIPRRLVQEINAGELDYYDDEIEVEDVQDAQDGGMNDESGYTEGGDAPAGNDDPMADPNAAPPGAPPVGGTPNV
ncbi:MAG: hypothetical protein EOP83_05985 [Verrucomicrobiaceae bacterium]|nr:MAG: hypothetical protein EOP83_05985 [Verrucomicrobiaceae bacterium]